MGDEVRPLSEWTLGEIALEEIIAAGEGELWEQ